MLAKVVSKMLAQVIAIAKVVTELSPARSPLFRLEVAVAEEAPPLRLEVAVVKGARRRNVAVEVAILAAVSEGDPYHDVDSNKNLRSRTCRTPLHQYDASGNNNTCPYLLSATPAPADNIFENDNFPVVQCMCER